MYDELAKRVEEAVVGVCWQQWRAIQSGGVASGEHPSPSIIDPEGLLLASLAMRHHEQRLRDLLRWWVLNGAHLLSVQRIKTLRALFPESRLDGGVEWFSSLAVEADGNRWKSLAGSVPRDEPARDAKGPKELQLLDPSTLQLRLRAGFGVGAKADVMAFLIGAGSARREQVIWTTVSVMSKAVGYSRAAIARAVSEMTLARFIEESADRPPVYSIEAASWARVFGLRDPYRVGTHVAEEHEESDIPPWRFWSQLFAFLVGFLQWEEAASEERYAPIVHASEARDLVERFGRFLAWNNIDLPDARVHAGERFLEPFVVLVEEVVKRVERLS